MITAQCVCGEQMTKFEAEVYRDGGVGPADTCRACRRRVQFVAAEELPDGSGAGDFDTSLTVIAGPRRTRVPVGTRFVLGGVPDLSIGKQESNEILLPGVKVSRVHARLLRVDFGPGKWFLENNKSTNGVYVNGSPSDAHELEAGDVIRLGEYQLQFDEVAPPSGPEPTRPPRPAESVKPPAGKPHPAMAGRVAGAPPVMLARDGEPCPSCGQTLPRGATICTDCGIRVGSGRPLVISRELDENEVEVQAQNTASLLSWIMPTGLYPLASEAYGHHKPYAVWTLVVVTILCSAAYNIAGYATPDGERPVGASLMLWPTHAVSFAGRPVLEKPIDELSAEEEDEVRRDLEAMPPRERLAWGMQQINGPPAPFRWYQLLSHALLHAGWLHLIGNMAFLMVFGTRVNALIGDGPTLVLYPLLAVAAGAAHLAWGSAGLPVPMLGASGAIMGLAGMYLVLFPVHRVFMLVWARWFLIFLPAFFIVLRVVGFRVSWKVFAVRGAWVVLFYIAFDVLFTLLGREDGTAHWAHLGGFVAGSALAVVLLVARLTDARGGDLLSVALGKWSWPLIGTPAVRNRRFAPARVADLPRGVPGTVSLSYPGA